MHLRDKIFATAIPVLKPIKKMETRGAGEVHG